MERSEGLSRRQMIGAAAGTAATAAVGSALVPGAAGAKKGLRSRENLVPRQNIGIQMYSLRDMLAADLPATLDMLEDIGYPEVELFQLHGLTAAELRALLDERSIRAMAAHVGIDRWRNDLETVLDEAETLGMHLRRRAGHLPAAAARPSRRTGAWRASSTGTARRRPTAACASTTTITTWSSPGTRARSCTTSCSKRTDPDLVFFELDLYWIVTAGRDPLDYLGTYDQSRWPLFHCKDRTTGTSAPAGPSPTSAKGSSTSSASSARWRTSTTTSSSSSATRRSTRRRRRAPATSTCATSGASGATSRTSPRRCARTRRPPRAPRARGTEAHALNAGGAPCGGAARRQLPWRAARLSRPAPSCPPRSPW